ncbi:SDR family NAD(P)-dependent oxidoreductase [Occultella gossypii]|uniref:SDR family oxidoreductase n=1 Tax=Occultella gossypii TaxID=2800820 RepID=A0ABS7S6S3_9MICO|nr:SDR family oxidoreductase [Occultella gossypii]MBZ2195583.1 SDR family oxidoreductase [Occultella gossypii]
MVWIPSTEGTGADPLRDGGASGGSVVVTGGSGGIGRVIADHLAESGQVVTLDPAPATHTSARIQHVQADAADAEACREAARLAETRGPLRGWVNNAAIFSDAGLATANATEIGALITANVSLALVGTHTAVRHFLTHGRPGSIVNVSSHQSQRPVRGALPYATAKAAVEGLTRAAAVDHGPQGIRVNAVALGSIATARYEEYRRAHPDVDAQMAVLHPLGHVGRPVDVAEAVAFLLSPQSAFITGVVIPIDGGRSVLGLDPEAR